MRTANARSPRSERGAILILTAVVMIVLLLIAAFAVDLGAWYRQGQEQQRAADIGSLNGIQGYDEALDAEFAAKSATSFDELANDVEREDAERAAMLAALDAITGSLAAGGINVSSTPTLLVGVPPADSVATVTADDGTVITITRTDGSIVVSTSRTGDQYFSNFVRDAPEITRSGTAKISSCNAICERDIELTPPFQGFDAAGSGDGYRPLVDRDNGRVWLINHLWDARDYAAFDYFSDVVCMDIEQQAICNDWQPLSKQFYGNMMPDEVIDHGRSRLYYPGMGQSVTPVNGRMLGTCDDYNIATDCEFFIACVDTANRGHCPPTKISDGAWGGGPWMVNDNLFAVDGDGYMYCIEPDLIGTANPWCAGYGANGRTTAAVGNVVAGTSDRSLILGATLGSQDHKLIIYHANSNKFHCWNTLSHSDCFGAVDAGFDERSTSKAASRFYRYNTSGDKVGWCLTRSGHLDYSTTGPVRHTCVNESGVVNSNDPIPNLSNSQSGRTWNQFHTWHGENGEARMFFSNYSPVYNDAADSGVISCYDWTTQNMCSIPTTDAGSDFDFYSFAEFSEDCLVAVGDVSKFYTFSPLTGEICTSSSVETAIQPCDCNDGSDEKRWGVLGLPLSFLEVLDSAHAFILDPTDGDKIINPEDGSKSNTAPSVDHAFAHDLIGEGPLDLSGLNSTYDHPLSLVIIVDGKINDDGTLKWQQPMSASYSLIVQPTLAG